MSQTALRPIVMDLVAEGYGHEDIFVKLLRRGLVKYADKAAIRTYVLAAARNQSKKTTDDADLLVAAVALEGL